MQYKNPIDVELVDAATETYTALTQILLSLNMSPDTGMLLRLKNSLHAAKTQMQAQEALEKEEFSFTESPPSSME